MVLKPTHSGTAAFTWVGVGGLGRKWIGFRPVFIGVTAGRWVAFGSFWAGRGPDAGRGGSGWVDETSEGAMPLFI